MTTETLYSSNPRRERRLRTKLGDGRGRTRRRRESVMRQSRDVIAWSSLSHRNSFHLLCVQLANCLLVSGGENLSCLPHHFCLFITSSKNILIKNVCFCFCFVVVVFLRGWGGGGGRQSMLCHCLATLPFRHPLSTWNSASKLCRETKDDDRPD